VLVCWAKAHLELGELPLELGVALADRAERTAARSEATTAGALRAARPVWRAVELSESSGAQVARSHQQTLEISKWPR
jgi:hypothetical protein